ncbi:MAG: spoIIIAH-like protein [Candidatus Improbicoccus devescovinae]|nr:MAG: spoIIIAH-like protein [Candidatus Improbicoccus devescovinae]
MVMRFHRKQVVLASLIMSLGIAVFLNWQLNPNKNLTTTEVLSSNKFTDKGIIKKIISKENLGEARYVNSNVAPDVQNPQNNTSNDEKNSHNHTEDKEENEKLKFYTTAETNRKQIYDQNLVILKNMTDKLKDIKNDHDDQKEQLAKQINKQIKKITSITQQQANIENIVLGKFDGKCLVTISGNSCFVIVTPKESNNLENLVEQIIDVVQGLTNFEPDNIKVIIK